MSHGWGEGNLRTASRPFFSSFRVGFCSPVAPSCSIWSPSQSLDSPSGLLYPSLRWAPCALCVWLYVDIPLPVGGHSWWGLELGGRGVLYSYVDVCIWLYMWYIKCVCVLCTWSCMCLCGEEQGRVEACERGHLTPGEGVLDQRLSCGCRSWLHRCWAGAPAATQLCDMGGLQPVVKAGHLTFCTLQNGAAQDTLWAQPS